MGAKAKALRLALVVVFSVLIAIIAYGPELKSATASAAVSAALVRVYADISYGKVYKQHISEGGLRTPHWKWVVAAIVGVAVWFGVFFAFVFGLGAAAPNLLPAKVFE
jgi:uncharacterized membrane-anchored protein